MIQPLLNITPTRRGMVHITEVNQVEVGQDLTQAKHGTLAPAEVQAVGEPTVNMIGITTSNRTLRTAMTRIGAIQTVTGKGKDFLKHQENLIQNKEGNLQYRTHRDITIFGTLNQNQDLFPFPSGRL